MRESIVRGAAAQIRECRTTSRHIGIVDLKLRCSVETCLERRSGAHAKWLERAIDAVCIGSGEIGLGSPVRRCGCRTNANDKTKRQISRPACCSNHPIRRRRGLDGQDARVGLLGFVGCATAFLNPSGLFGRNEFQNGFCRCRAVVHRRFDRLCHFAFTFCEIIIGFAKRAARRSQSSVGFALVFRAGFHTLYSIDGVGPEFFGCREACTCGLVIAELVADSTLENVENELLVQRKRRMRNRKLRSGFRPLFEPNWRYGRREGCSFE